MVQNTYIYEGKKGGNEQDMKENRKINRVQKHNARNFIADKLLVVI